MRRASAALFVALVILSAGTAAIVARPDRTQGDAFLFGDEGHSLWVTSSLASGKELYTGVYTPYGPAGVWLYYGAASLLENTAATYQALNVALSLVSLVLLQQTLARTGSLGWSVVWTLAAMVPSMLAPGSLLGGLTVSPYVGLERLVLCVVAWRWRPPTTRTAWQSVLLGCVAGGLVWVKFGTTALVVFGVVVADLVPRRDLRATALFVAGAGATAAVFVGCAFLIYPASVAADLVWPSFLLESYVWVTPETRWPSFLPLAVVALQYAPPLAGLALCVAVVAVKGLSPSARLAVPLLAIFVAGSALTFQHAHHVRQYAWLLAAAGGLAAAGLDRRWRIAAVLAVLPACVVAARGVVPPTLPAVRVQTPALGALFLSPDVASRSAALAEYAEQAHARGERILVAPNAAGWHAAHDVPISGRHGWFLGGVMRPWEQDAAVSHFERLSAVIICAGADDRWEDLYLPPSVLARVRPLFPVRKGVADCALWRRR